MLRSNAFWRIVLVIVIILMLPQLFFSGKNQLQKHGFMRTDISQQDREAYLNGDTEGSDVLYQPLPPDASIDWSQFAYCQYATSKKYLCNSLMIFESLVRLQAKAERMLLYPEEWIAGDGSDQGRLLAKARDEYGVRLVPIHVQHFAGGGEDEETWTDSFTKLLAFNQTQYKRVLSLDSDSTLLQPMDELFLLPSAPVAMPHAYWLDAHILSSQVVLLEPSKAEFQRIEAAFATRAPDKYDMEIVNDLYGNNCFIIPHRRYDLVTGELMSEPDQHWKYLGSTKGTWDANKVLAEVKFVHFSDWPYKKPWVETAEEETEENQPECRDVGGGKEDCRDRDVWAWLYKDFRERRGRVCGGGFSKREEG